MIDRAMPLAASALLAAAVACVSMPKAATAPSVPRSRVAFEVIPSSAAPMPVSASIERTRPAAVEKLTMPSVPPALMAAAPVRAAVSVRVTVGSDGRVSQVRPSPLAASHAGPWLELLLESIRRAASMWQFLPARERTLSDGPDRDHDGLPDWQNVVSSRAIAVYFDARFTFEVANGSGRVTVGSARR